MKYENIETVNKLIKQIKSDEKQLEKLSGTGLTIALIDDKSVRIDYVKLGYEHPYHKQAQSFVDDCIQILRDKITKMKSELEEL